MRRAMQRGATTQGTAFVSGGVTTEERRSLHEQRGAYSLWVVTAASKSGAYLADVRVTVRDERQRELFDGRLDGPWLFLALPPGSYRVQASHAERSQTRSTTIHVGDRHQLFFYFDTGDEVGREDEAAVHRNPYGDATRR